MDLEQEIASLQNLADRSGTKKYHSDLERLLREIEGAEAALGQTTDGAFVIGTARKPLSMYGKEIWQKSFVSLFPHGDGVFGIRRRRAMTFQQ